MKKFFEEPKAELVSFRVCDCIATSVEETTIEDDNSSSSNTGNSGFGPSF